MKIIERIVNAETGEVTDIERNETTAEKSQREASQAAIQAEIAIQAEKDAARQAVLAKLGLTAEDAAALLG